MKQLQYLLMIMQLLIVNLLWNLDASVRKIMT